MITITGGVISKQNGMVVTYQMKCDKCQNIDNHEVMVTLTKGVIEVMTRKCPNCGNNQVVKMKYVENAMV
jgi:RNase P subunit RPR2